MVCGEPDILTYRSSFVSQQKSGLEIEPALETSNCRKAVGLLAEPFLDPVSVFGQHEVDCVDRCRRILAFVANDDHLVKAGCRLFGIIAFKDGGFTIGREDVAGQQSNELCRVVASGCPTWQSCFRTL